MKQKQYIIAIDPDVDKSGVAVLDREQGAFKDLVALPFPTLIELLRYYAEHYLEETIVYVEAGWLCSAHWHLAPHDSKRQAAAKGNAAGRNHETGRKIVEMSRHYNLPTLELKPFLKRWRGREGKITHEEFARLTGYQYRTNQETRDAGLIAWYNK